MTTRSYLDYNATAPLRPEVRDAMVAALAAYGNPSSVHAEGREARALIEAARTKGPPLALARAPIAHAMKRGPRLGPLRHL